MIFLLSYLPSPAVLRRIRPERRKVIFSNHIQGRDTYREGWRGGERIRDPSPPPPPRNVTGLFNRQQLPRTRPETLPLFLSPETFSVNNGILVF